MPGVDYFLNRFIMIYKENQKMRDDLYVCLLHGVVAKMSGNHNPSLPLNA